MNYITTTDLRTKSKELVKTLQNGGTVNIIHRSKIIGEIRPKKEVKTLTKDGIERLKKLAKALNLPETSYREREKIYRKHLMEKYGQNLS